MIRFFSNLSVRLTKEEEDILQDLLDTYASEKGSRSDRFRKMLHRLNADETPDISIRPGERDNLDPTDPANWFREEEETEADEEEQLREQVEEEEAEEGSEASESL